MGKYTNIIHANGKLNITCAIAANVLNDRYITIGCLDNFAARKNFLDAGIVWMLEVRKKIVGHLEETCGQLLSVCQLRSIGAVCVSSVIAPS